MKKSQLSIGLMTALLSTATLAGCTTDLVKYSPEGTVIKYTVGGTTTSLTAEQLFVKLVGDSDDSKYQSIFEALKSIIIRNYFYVDTGDRKDNGTYKLGIDDLPELELEADHEVEKLTDQARTNANANNTLYSDELETLLNGANLKDKTLEAYRQKKLDELMEERFTDNFYTHQRNTLVEGDNDFSNYWAGYFKDNVPYHVSHILVKFDDVSGSDYATDKISEQSALNLSYVIDDLKSGKNTFGEVAYEYGQVDEGKYADSGSAKQKGDLGIMGFDTSYVPEFKLGIYAYENIYGKYFDQAQTNEKVGIPEYENIGITGKSSIAESFIDEAEKSFANDNDDTLDPYYGFPIVSIDVFDELARVADVEADKYGEKVMDGNEMVYPRNLIYNRYLNRHSFAFIGDTVKSMYSTSSNEPTQELAADCADGLAGFHTYADADFTADTKTSALNGKKVLSVKVAGEFRPIIMVRAGSGYQGIHFIVVNRDYFLEGEDKNGVNRTEYYTTYHTDQKEYPTTDGGAPKKTYVNFNKLETSDDTDSRADDLLNKFKAFETTKQGKYFFKKYMEKENLHLEDKQLEYGLMKWLDDDAKQEKKDFQENLKKEWKDYVSTLRKQNDSRKNLVSLGAEIAFSDDINTYVNGKGEITKAKLTEFCDQYTLMTGSEISDLMDEIPFDVYDGVTEPTDADYYVVLEDLYNKKGGVFNDGEKHN